MKNKTPGDALPGTPSPGLVYDQDELVTQADLSQGRDQHGQPHQRITRSSWPTGKKERLEAIKAALPQALGEYFGSTVAIAAAFSLLPQEIEAAIASEPALAEAQRVYQNSVDARLEDVVTHAALAEGNVAAAKYLLERRNPARWVRQSVNKKDDRPAMAVPDAPLVPAFKSKES